jgi:hypothetical protein
MSKLFKLGMGLNQAMCRPAKRPVRNTHDRANSFQLLLYLPAGTGLGKTNHCAAVSVWKVLTLILKLPDTRKGPKAAWS